MGVTPRVPPACPYKAQPVQSLAFANSQQWSSQTKLSVTHTTPLLLPSELFNLVAVEICL